MTYKIFSPTGPDIRYIRLGKAGAWAARGLEAGEIPFGYREIGHELASSGDETALVAAFQALGQTPGAARQSAREVLAFYEEAPARVWVTAHAGRLWWARAEGGVTWTGDLSGAYGARLRRVAGAWRCTDVQGRALRLDQLSSALTQVRRYRRTTCPAPAGLWDLIEARPDPLLDQVADAQARLVEGLSALIARLDEKDFETFVALALERAGWRRVSMVGGPQEEIDFALEQPLTGQRAGVQVKSSASAERLRQCAQILQARGYDLFVLACHSVRGEVGALAPGVRLLDRAALARLAYDAGLADWLMKLGRGGVTRG